MAGRPKNGELTETQNRVLMACFHSLMRDGLPVRGSVITEMTGVKEISWKLMALERRGLITFINIKQGIDYGWAVTEARLPDGRSAKVTAEITFDDEFHVYRFAADLKRLKKVIKKRACLCCRRFFEAYGRFDFLCDPCGVAAASDILTEYAGSLGYVSQPEAMISGRRAGFRRAG